MTAKITGDMLVFIISAFCGFKDPKISRVQKEDCMEFATNCMIVQDGYSTDEVVNLCKEKWSDIERSRRVQSGR